MPLPKLPYKWRIWLHGLFAAVIGAGSNAVVLGWVDPTDFNPLLTGDWSQLWKFFIGSGVIAFFIYVKSHPLPSPEKDTDYMQVVGDKIDKLEGTGTGTGSGTGDGSR